MKVTVRTRISTAPRTTTLGDMGEQQGVQVSTYFRRKVLEPGHLVLDTSDKQCADMQEEE